MTFNTNAQEMGAIDDAELEAVHGGLSIQTAMVEPIITTQMIANFHIDQYFVPRIRVTPRG